MAKDLYEYGPVPLLQLGGIASAPALALALAQAVDSSLLQVVFPATSNKMLISTISAMLGVIGFAAATTTSLMVCNEDNCMLHYLL